MKTLRDIKIGETAKVVKLHSVGAVKRRIMDMGLTKVIFARLLLSVTLSRSPYVAMSFQSVRLMLK